MCIIFREIRFDLNKQYLDKEKAELICDINKEIEKIKTKIPKNQDKQEELQLLEQSKNKIKVISDKEIEAVNSTEIELYKVSGTYKYLFWDKKSSYKYSSSSSAKDDAKQAISKTISSIAKELRYNAIDIVDSAESYISANGIPERFRNDMEKDYEEIRKILAENNCKIRTGFNIMLNIPNDASNSLKYVHDRARRIDQSFSGPEHYIQYDCDLYIDYEYKTEYVSTIFGGTREKEVKKYSYDAEGAMDNVASEACDKISDLRDEIFRSKPPIREVFNNIKTDLVNQYKALINDINIEVDKKISEIKDESNKLNSDIKKEQEKIDKLEQLLKEIADI